MARAVAVVLLVTAALAGVGALFLAYFSVRLVYEVLTFEGEGSLGHVGMTIAAVVYPVATLVAAGIAWIAGSSGWRRWRLRR